LPMLYLIGVVTKSKFWCLKSVDLRSQLESAMMVIFCVFMV